MRGLYFFMVLSCLALGSLGTSAAVNPASENDLGCPVFLNGGVMAIALNQQGITGSDVHAASNAELREVPFEILFKPPDPDIAGAATLKKSKSILQSDKPLYLIVNAFLI